MEKENFYKILCSTTPEELNKFISQHGKKKMANAITFIDNNDGGENNGECKRSNQNCNR